MFVLRNKPTFVTESIRLNSLMPAKAGSLVRMITKEAVQMQTAAWIKIHTAGPCTIDIVYLTTHQQCKKKKTRMPPKKLAHIRFACDNWDVGERECHVVIYASMHNTTSTTAWRAWEPYRPISATGRPGIERTLHQCGTEADRMDILQCHM